MNDRVTDKLYVEDDNARMTALLRQNEDLREQLKSAKYCLYFLLEKNGGTMQIRKHDIEALHPDDAVVRYEDQESGDMMFTIRRQPNRYKDSAT